jgi:cold shock CspA family protein
MNVTGEIERVKEGYCFIKGSDGRSYFAHSSAFPRGTILNVTIRKGQRVEFEPSDSPKGPRAERVRLLV